MNNKIVIGLLGDDIPLRAKVTKAFVDIGFHKTSVASKTNELAKYLLPGDIFPEETIQQIRERGYKVSNYYWINLVLASVPDNKDLIIVDDLQEKDIIDGVIISYRVVDKDQPDDHNAINANSDNLEVDVHNKIKRIAAN